ncbi:MULTISPECIES: hypothetical protein [unclassified Streptomyces]|uniref:hypothetical protein n=1 Tax=unclassified Streptomyces TaxID=2593676 RepID=UPI002E3299FE|nr:MULTISPECIES: hypothetical protein [unclassified Streptomyces]
MNALSGVKRTMALGITTLAAIAVSAVPGSAAPATGPAQGGSDHWGVITRNTIGSPVAALRNGPFGSFGVTGRAARPPYGTGSLGIEVADNSTSLTPPSEKVDFGNEVDFYGDPVLGLTRVGFHVFQTGENTTHGGPGNMPNIRFEINPRLTAAPGTTYSSMVWAPPASPVTDRWSPYLDATTSGTWFLTGNAGTVTGCNQSTPCTFPQLKTALNDGGQAPTIYTAAVGKGRDNLWAGAVDGLRINRNIYDFEAGGVRTLRAN